ncbi:MAG: LytR/AlgR family response regulator transcription factor [Flavobacteriales bacterium]
MATIKCLVVDDEELARTLLATYIEKLDFLVLVATAQNPLEAMQIMKQQPIDLIFLDIQMPELKGTDFAKMIAPTSKIIFTTAYSEYALEGFELNALDYLLKPITFERFLKAVSKVQISQEDNADNTITVKSGYDLFKLKLDNITHIESDSEYVIFHTPDKKIMSLQSLKSLEKSLDATMFMRVHRSFIINKTKVTGLKGRELLLSNIKISVSDSYFEEVKKELF